MDLYNARDMSADVALELDTNSVSCLRLIVEELESKGLTVNTLASVASCDSKRLQNVQVDFARLDFTTPY